MNTDARRSRAAHPALLITHATTVDQDEPTPAPSQPHWPTDMLRLLGAVVIGGLAVGVLIAVVIGGVVLLLIP